MWQCSVQTDPPKDDRIAAAYQRKEDEEKSREFVGHSVLSRARALVGLMDTRQYQHGGKVAVWQGMYLRVFDRSAEGWCAARAQCLSQFPRFQHLRIKIDMPECSVELAR